MSHDTITSHIVSTRFIAAAIFMVLAVAATGGTAQAAEAAHYDRAIVSYGDLNLDSQQGTKMLYARLRNGAEDVCSSIDGRNLFLKKLWQTCFDEAVTAAVLQVNRPSLTTLHSQTVGRLTGDR